MGSFQKLSIAFGKLYGERNRAITRNVAFGLLYFSAGDLVYKSWKFITDPKEPSNLHLMTNLADIKNARLERDKGDMAGFEKLNKALADVELMLDPVLEMQNLKIRQLNILVENKKRLIEEQKMILKEAKCYPIVTTEYQASVERCRRKLRARIAQMHCASNVIYLVWHLSGIKDLHTGVTNHHKAVELLEPLKQEFPILSYADFYQLAGVVAVEIAGGPEIPFHPGRLDRTGAPLELISVPSLNYKDVVALAGAQVLAGSDDASSYVAFDNSYFKELLKGNCQLPLGKGLLENPETRQLVHFYATDEDSFFMEYVTAHLKLSEIGFADVE